MIERLTHMPPGTIGSQQTIAAAFPAAAPHAQRTPPVGPDPPRADPAETLRELTKLHQRGVITDAELEGLRARLRV